MRDTALGVIEAIGYAGLIAILIIATVRTIIDVARALDLLPQVLRDFFRRGRREEVAVVLEELGLLRHKRRFEAMADSLSVNAAELISVDEARKDLEEWIRRSIEVGVYSIGATQTVEGKHFINLRKFVLGREVDQLALAFASYIEHVCTHDGVAYDAIATPCTSALPLAHRVASFLGRRLLVRDEGTKTIVGGKSWTVVGRETNETLQGISVILIDESVVSGGELNRTFAALERSGITCEHAFVIFHRREGELSRYPEFAKRVSLHCVLQYADSDLARLAGTEA